MDQQPTIDYRLLVDNMTTAILLVDSNLNIFYLNSSCEALFDISLLRASGQPVINLLHAPNDTFNTHEALLNTLKSSQHYTRREATINVNFKDIHVDYTVSQLNTGKPYHPLLLIELNPIDRMLKISKEENFIQQHQVARQLIRGVAHEIKNPLGGIRGATQLLARSLNDPKYAEFTDIIINEVDRLRNLADTMLGSRQLPSYEDVNIHEPLERVRSLIVNQTKKKIKIIRDYDLSLPDVKADRDQLIQVMLNISVNAIQAITENKEFFVEHEPQLMLRTRIQRLVTINGVLNRSAVRIDIEDNGPGIPEDILESVFYPLVTGRAKGTGLGLSIAQNIMHQHNGMIECQSIPGKTVFSLYLPWESDHVAK
ncbi:two-component system nitrogen regulation sensor histidine kinase GlnL [Acinetobacter baylyi]|uniref:Sensory histidine kinase/phosphatase NtrB n=2 Tax=Acinetobacter baylyi TaxID=202950 RepID=Q6FCH5_ACIAD|nr:MULTISPECIES: nitrogen regulation protein NR(II) [Acinetobacter]KAF2369738.1 PAS domain-containing sensor histidine kinase [Acinetobacter baylyi]KAF2371678.1 PAS domain-containing sensor histidine kinase [Acinetobacter baylyi]KAF2378663.1 PAS domain-containing sensor histidine kinase [Acinetobacter baylyi]KAF2380271.1 PAS domain-containing sensor histidine kinase [Acinetobacter baylyi]KAF2382545.1 PAS domain-containing sensor histidine kinase [Acinetobacter baylyi]